MADTNGEKDLFEPRHDEKSSADDFLIVGLGASAGGITALKDFFAHTPVDSGIAFVVVLHLSPDYESHLAQVLQTATQIPVTQVRDREKVRPNHIYVVSPNRSLAMNDGHLSISEITRVEERRAPIDIFFRTLAEFHHTRAVTVVLSGTGADGSMGMKRVKVFGGLCIVQDPQEAEHADMPQNCIATRLVDHILPAAQIPGWIVSYDKHRNTVEIPPTIALGNEPDETALREIFTQLRMRTGHDFSSYKRSTVLRRIQRRVTVHGLPDLQSYATLFRENPDEARAVLKDLLISVTNFFRDAETFEALKRRVIPKLFENKGPDDQVRVWVCGCATGEEAYSIAMLLLEYAAELPAAPTLQVFATDIDDWALGKARAGYYTLNDAADVSPERLRKFFQQENEGYRVRREVRETVLFAAHNVLKDPPFSHLDLLTCRNLLIYLNRAAQERIMQVIHFALGAGGYLFLGTSESAEGSHHLFHPFDKENHIYQARALEPRLALPLQTPFTSPGHLRVATEKPDPVAERRTRERLSYPELHQRLLEQFAPPSIIVNEEYEILHVSESAGQYLQITGGEPTNNLLKVVRPELRLDLRTALYQAVQNRTNVEARGIAVQIEGRALHVDLLVRPVLRENDSVRGYLVVLFEETDVPAPSNVQAVKTVSESAEPIARHLEEELLRAKAQLRATVEQHELNQEELKASNEELQAMNEEMRSSTEELETSKEELQSVNEELTTVNQELKIKIEELSQSNSDFKNLMSSTDIGTIFLDRALRIKLFTPRAKDIFNLIPADVGRPLSDITSRLHDAVHTTDAERVLERLQTVERELQTKEGRWHLMRMLPYRSNDDRIDGVVITFLDITSRKESEVLLQASEAQFRRAIEDAPIPVVLYCEDGTILQVNRSWTLQTGYAIADMPNLETWMRIITGGSASAFRTHVSQLTSGERHSIEMDLTIRTQSGDTRYWSFSASSPGSLADGRRFMVGMAVDLTDRQITAAALRESEERHRLIVENARDFAIFMVDPQGKVASWNTGAERIFRFKEAEIVGREMDILFITEDRATDQPAKELATAATQGRASDDRWQLRRDGSQFWASGVTASMRSEDGLLLGYTKILRDLTSQKQADEALQLAHEALETRVQERTRELRDANVILQKEMLERKAAEDARFELVQRLASAQEDERRHIARELHDEMGQLIAALIMEIRALESVVPQSPDVHARLRQSQQIADQIGRELHDVALQLRPTSLDDLGLHAALPQYIETWAARSGVHAEFHSSGMQDRRLPSPIETTLYRIIQEALTNVAKHAGASQVSVVLERRDQQVIAIIEDDGTSFDVEQTLLSSQAHRRLGLIGMRERLNALQGTLEIESSPGQGTTVFASVPLPPSQE